MKIYEKCVRILEKFEGCLKEIQNKMREIFNEVWKNLRGGDI